MATAVALAKGAAPASTLFVIVPLDQELDAPLHELEEQASASLAEAVLLGEENGVRSSRSPSGRARSRRAIVEQAADRGSDLIVVGSSPRWRRQSASSRRRSTTCSGTPLRGARRRVSAGCSRT